MVCGSSESIDVPKQSTWVKFQHVGDFQKLDHVQPTLASFKLGHERLRPFELLGKLLLRKASFSTGAREYRT